jgi:alkylation response protein AidB-like acyl-CoA dehydrogenase
MADTQQPPTDEMWDSVLTELAERRSEFHAQGYVPRDFIEKFFPFGVYRHATPMKFGGETIPPHEFLQMIERIGRVDGSTAWVVGFASANTYLGALPIDTQAQIYENGPDVVTAGGLFPMQRAERTAAGFRVSGRWKFASGCMAADYINVGLLDDRRARCRSCRTGTSTAWAPPVRSTPCWRTSRSRWSGRSSAVARR